MSRLPIRWPHLGSSWFHWPSRRCDRWILLHIGKSFGTWTQCLLSDTNNMTKMAFKKVSRFRILWPHLESRQFHEPRWSCERWILFHFQNSFGTWTRCLLTNTNNITKVAFKKVSRFRILRPRLRSSQCHGPRRSCDRWILFRIEDIFWDVNTMFIDQYK